MSDEIGKIIAVALVAVVQAYAAGYRFPVLAIVWDLLAKITGYLAWYLGRFSINARLNYFAVVKTYG